MKIKRQMMNWKLISLTLLGLLIVAIVFLGFLLSEAKGYTVVMSNCDEGLALLGEHIVSFADLDEAKEWADTMLDIRYDMAVIYLLDSPSRLTQLRWIKSETCYDGLYLDWFEYE